MVSKMNGNKRVVVAMSGGVDSSVAAALLKRQGYEVIGISMQLWDNSGDDSHGTCCSIDDIHDARRVAGDIGIPHYVLNLEEEFSRYVVDYFVDSYLKGETPNPCLKCNEHLKFDILLRKAIELEADYLATGHYARIVYDEREGRYRLLKGVDHSKDQSYFLFTLTQRELSLLIFPVGSMTKSEVRAIAGEMGLRVAEKRDSQEICFVPHGDYGAFVSERAGSYIEGDILYNGRVVGRHSGIHRYTIGQRRGIGVAIGSPVYVTGLDTRTGRLFVGDEEDLFSYGLKAYAVNWVGSAPDRGFRAYSRIRYRHQGVGSTVYLEDDGIRVFFDEPQRAVTPGQAVVLYDGEEVVGGGWIKEVLKDRVDIEQESMD